MKDSLQTVIDIAKVIGATGAATGITIADINGGLTTVSICLAISYTVWKWYKDYRNE